MGPAWNEGKAERLDQQAPGWRKEKGRDSRVQRIEGVLKGGLAAVTPMGKHQKTLLHIFILYIIIRKIHSIN